VAKYISPQTYCGWPRSTVRHPRESAPAGNWCLRHRCGSDENQYRSTRLPEIATATPFSGYAAQPFQCDIAPIRPSPAHAHHLGTLVDVRMHRGYVRLQLADKAPTRTPIGCCANTCTRTPTCPRSPRTRSTLSPRKSTTARVECSGGQPRPRLSVLPSHADAASACVAVRFSATIMTVATGDQVPEHVRGEIRVECDVAHGI